MTSRGFHTRFASVSCIKDAIFDTFLELLKYMFSKELTLL